MGCLNCWVATSRLCRAAYRDVKFGGVGSRWSFPAGQPPRGGCYLVDTRSVLTHVSGSLSGREVNWGQVVRSMTCLKTTLPQVDHFMEDALTIYCPDLSDSSDLQAWCALDSLGWSGSLESRGW